MTHKFESNLANYTRIFILSGKNVPSEDLQASFEKFGTINEFRYLKDKGGIAKGITYITYSKPSEAAQAIEQMNGTMLTGSDRAIKVILASDKSEGNVRDPDEENRMRRLFIIVPSEFDESLAEYFSQFGEILAIKKLAPSKGKTLAYITFKSSYCAAKAIEDCDPAFKAVFAQTRTQHMEKGRDRTQDMDRSAGRPRNPRDVDNYGYERSLAPKPLLNRRPTFKLPQEVTLYAQMIPNLDGRMVNNLFNLAPGLVSCHYNSISGETELKYSNMDEGAFVIQRFSNFQYPPNCPISIYSEELNDEGVPNIQSLVQTIEKATNLLQQAGFMSSTPIGLKGRGNAMDYGFELPPRQPVLPESTPSVERLFIVTSPGQLPLDVLEDLFCRFGDLLTYNYIGTKTYGYVRYASSESAHMAIQMLHKKTIMGTYLKVILADPPNKEENNAAGKRKNTTMYEDQNLGFKYSKFE